MVSGMNLDTDPETTWAHAEIIRLAALLDDPTRGVADRLIDSAQWDAACRALGLEDAIDIGWTSDPGSEVTFHPNADRLSAAKFHIEADAIRLDLTAELLRATEHKLQHEEETNRRLAEAAAVGERATSCAIGDNAERMSQAAKRAERVMSIYSRVFGEVLVERERDGQPAHGAKAEAYRRTADEMNALVRAGKLSPLEAESDASVKKIVLQRSAEKVRTPPGG